MRELIYKDEAYKAIDNCIRDGWDRISPADAKMNIHHLVSDANEADRPQGEWIRDRYWSRGIGMGEEYGFFYKCSLCEYEVEDGYTRCGFNFCPHCGAEMKGAGDGTD